MWCSVPTFSAVTTWRWCLIQTFLPTTRFPLVTQRRLVLVAFSRPISLVSRFGSWPRWVFISRAGFGFRASISGMRVRMIVIFFSWALIAGHGWSSSIGSSWVRLNVAAFLMDCRFQHAKKSPMLWIQIPKFQAFSLFTFPFTQSFPPPQPGTPTAPPLVPLYFSPSFIWACRLIMLF